MKFQRTWSMEIDGRTQSWRIGMPFTVRFHTTAVGRPMPFSARFYLYNAPENMRNDIDKETFDGALSEDRRVVFSAGYESDTTIPTVFVGNVYQAVSHREGPDWVTEIEALDGGWAMQNGHIDKTFAAGTSLVQIIKEIAAALPGVKVGYISPKLTSLSSERGEVCSGRAWDELKKRLIPLDAEVFISRETLYVLTQGEAIPNRGGIVRLGGETGIIGTPRRHGALVTFTMVFEPRLDVGNEASIETALPFSAAGKVIFVDHVGTISASSADGLITKATIRWKDVAI